MVWYRFLKEKTYEGLHYTTTGIFYRVKQWGEFARWNYVVFNDGADVYVRLHSTVIDARDGVICCSYWYSVGVSFRNDLCP